MRLSSTAVAASWVVPSFLPSFLSFSLSFSLFLLLSLSCDPSLLGFLQLRLPHFFLHVEAITRALPESISMYCRLVALLFPACLELRIILQGGNIPYGETSKGYSTAWRRSVPFSLRGWVLSNDSRNSLGLLALVLTRLPNHRSRKKKKERWKKIPHFSSALFQRRLA